MSYVISNYMIRENCRRHMIFLFEFLESWMSQQSNRNIWHHDWPCPFGSWTDFGILSQPARIQALYFLCRTYLHSRTHNCPANPSYLTEFAIFCSIHLSVIASLLIHPVSLRSAVLDSISPRDKVLFSFEGRH